MKKIVFPSLLLISALLFSFHISAQDCKVKMKEISGKYEGDCKKGFAHGSGKAVGTDTYEGGFKKGLPHGKGTYTWANGDVYVGEFKNGKKNGAGKLTSASGTITGYWIDDQYIGQEKYPYRLLSADSNITDVTFTRIGDSPNQIDITYELKGRKTEHQNIRIKHLDGNYTSIVQDPYLKSIKQVTFPIRLLIEGKENFDIKINQPGHWELKVKLTAN